MSPGLAMGPAFRQDMDLSQVSARRVPRDQVEGELNRFHRALSDAKAQLEQLRKRLVPHVPEDQVRILDTHLTYLKDSVFLSDVENLILGEQMSLEGSIAKVVLDFDRIFQLVASESLRERAVDLRDVGIRVLRCIERAESGSKELAQPAAGHILVARELSIVDMFNLDGERVRGILTESGSITSHAAVLARSMRIPTLTGLEGLLEQVSEGDFLIVDATEGLVRVRPEETVREQFLEQSREASAHAETDLPSSWCRLPATTKDDVTIELLAACGNLPEVERGAQYGLPEVALYRTELLYCIDREAPSVDALEAHYRAVLTHAPGNLVCFRLLDVDSDDHITYLHEKPERNPGLGKIGVRALLANEIILRRQLNALDRAAAGLELRIAVPKVVDCGELRRVREVLFEERYALTHAGIEHAQDVQLGVIIETPASVIGIRDLAQEADFLMLGLDSLQQYLLAADRDNAQLAPYFQRLHPFVVRTLIELVQVGEELGKPLTVFGASVTTSANLPLLIGAGVTRLCVAPLSARSTLAAIQEIDSVSARKAARFAHQAKSPEEFAPRLEGYGHKR